MTLVEFLLARLAEDEAQVTDGAQGVDTSAFGWHTVECGVDLGYWATGVCSCRYVERVLRDIAAKRAIVRWVQQWPWRAEPPSSVDGLLEQLAAVYAGHLDWREEWKA